MILAVANFQILNIEELWVAFGVGKHFRYIRVHQIVNTLGVEKSEALPFLHALKGCDTASAFAGRERNLHLKLERLSRYNPYIAKELSVHDRTLLSDSLCFSTAGHAH